jgi:drug/metabolite transporter (DMT)-like permease
MSRKTIAHLLLFITAFIWGSAFVAQKEGMAYLGPFTFMGIRMFVGSAALIPVIFLLRKKKFVSNERIPQTEEGNSDQTLNGGFTCGVVMFLALSFQQIGLLYTTAGKAGFITAMYIIIVPLIGLFWKKRVSKTIWMCILIAMVGIYLLCMDSDFAVNKGDFLMLLSALGFAVHIIAIDHFSPKANPVKMSSIQFFVCGLLCTPMIIMESPELSNILLSSFPIFYTGVISCAIAYTLQVVAQRNTAPAVAALILSFESVFAVLAGFAMLNEILAAKEIMGCMLMFAAIVTAQLPEQSIKRLAARLLPAPRAY